MAISVIDHFRREVVTDALKIKSASKSLDAWGKVIDEKLGGILTGKGVLGLGDHMREIFFASGGDGRAVSESNSVVAAGGAAWESLVCWYLNFCLIGTNGIVVKSKREFLPRYVADAISVKYNNFRSNTEADLVFLILPELNEPILDGERCSDYLDRILSTSGGPGKIEIGIIQTKTNWNDNAQIPMLWDMVYSAKKFGRNISVGVNGRSIESFKEFCYSFVTVPSQKDIDKNFRATSTAVNRVRYLSGGNFWGLDSKSGVSDSLSQFVGRNMSSCIPGHDLISWLDSKVPNISGDYGYFLFGSEHYYLGSN